MTKPAPDHPYAVLFEPVQIGPVRTRNRFYQVPHCTGMGYRYPNAEARLRGIKAEGGWGVVCTQETEIHPSSDITPANEGRLWDDRDIPALQLMTNAVHAHDSLAGIQLVHNGLHTANRYSRMVPLAPSHAPVDTNDPVQARAMDKADIRQFRQWHQDAARRAKAAGFDIVYVYAGHDMSLLQHFLLRRHNHRTDEYGGSLENRTRLLREVIADTRDAVGDRCAVAVRLAVDELMGQAGLQHNGEAYDIVAALAEEPDLWDVNLSGWANDSQSARFSAEGYQEPYTRFVKSLTTKPVVGVGRYTSPDTMARLVRSGHLDLIGAARPSIADPFLPNKIEQGQTEDIRECIGCNICVSGDNTCVPMRCTQNPTIGEEWRRGWHPEQLPEMASTDSCLIVGGGPAGLEAAVVLANAGWSVTIAEAGPEWGGRVVSESRLPGLASWLRVRDWRLGQLNRRANVSMYLDSELSADDVLQSGQAHVIVATGARWRTDGAGRTHRSAPSFLSAESIGIRMVISPEAVMNDALSSLAPNQRVLVYDDDRFYMGGAIAQAAINAGHRVSLLTPAAVVSPWAENTLEQSRIQQGLLNDGARVIPLHELGGVSADEVIARCVYTGQEQSIECDVLVPVTARLPIDSLYSSLMMLAPAWSEAGIKSVTQAGDCIAPGLIATAVYSGHQQARRLLGDDQQFVRREDMTPIQVEN